MTKYQKGFWPTYEQELLLKTIVCEDKDALDNWKKWRARIDFRTIDVGSQRLFPLLYKRIISLGITDSLTPKLKGFYKLSWSKNQLLFHKAMPILSELNNSNIKTIILKGSALTLLYYKDIGLRPMVDFDILVKKQDIPKTIDILKKNNWKPNPSNIKNSFYWTNAHEFKNEGAFKIDLHWNLLSECLCKTDNNFWDLAKPASFNNIPVYVLEPVDQLLQICIHGAKWNIIPPCRWVIDAITIINNDGDNIDWDRIVFQSKKFYVSKIIYETLSYLKQNYAALIPTSTTDTLSNEPLSKLENMEYKTRHCAYNKIGIIRALCLHYLSYLRSNTKPHSFTNFITFLKNLWGIKYLWMLPFYGVFKLIRRMTFLVLCHCESSIFFRP